MSGQTRSYRPREVAELLGVPPSTLRTYAATFGQLLSEEARPDGGHGKGFRHRRYGEADLRVLREAKNLLDAGMSYQAALSRLGGSDFPRPSPRRRSVRPHLRTVSIDSPPAAPARPVPPPLDLPRSEVPLSVTVAGVDDLRDEIRSLRRDLAASKAASDHLPTPVDLAEIHRLGIQLEEVQERLGRLEALLAALVTTPARPGWLARIVRGT